MALHNDLDPLPSTSAVNKTKNLTNPLQKIKPIVSRPVSKLANAIFLLGAFFRKAQSDAYNTASLSLKAILMLFNKIKPVLPHLSISLVAIIVILTNLIVKYAKADYTVSFPEPSSEIALASNVDQFTPLIPQDGISADNAYKNSGGPFIALSNNVNTAITEREDPMPDNSSATISYTIQDGDTLTSLGWKFEVKLATLMYLNDIENANLVKPGQTLKIPPRGYEVPASQIAKKQRELASAKRNTAVRNSSNGRTANAAPSRVNHGKGSSQNGYPFGYCTYYVASQRYVPAHWGNAKNWLNSAQRSGYSTGRQPAVGAIGVTSESWWGHVVYVESVNGSSVTFSEMNAVGWGKISTRTLPASAFRGFIY